MKTIQSIDKVMRILDFVAMHNGLVTLTDISRGLNMAVTTLHGFTSTLEHWHMLCRNSAGRYSLGPKLLQLSLFCREQKLYTAVHPHLSELAQEFGETVHFGIRMGDDLTYVDRAEPEIPFRTTAPKGNTVPYYDSAIGLIISVANGKPIPASYLVHCNNMARDGYCLKFEPEMDAYCIAVPFLPPGMPCTSGFSVVLPVTRYSPVFVQNIVKRIREVTQTLSLS